MLRALRTIRWLRGRQIVGQVRQRVRRIVEHPASAARRTQPGRPICRWQPSEEFPPPGAQPNQASGLLGGSFCFLNRTERIGWPPCWAQPDLPRLWEYNLHYFEYLWALSYVDARLLTRDWMANHPLGRDRVGWEAYPISLRLQNWCAFFFGRHRERTQEDAPFRDALWGSIQLQAGWLRDHLETHLLGNHLLENGAALAFCGACFGGEAAESWLQVGRAILSEELPEQVLPDAGHFERSPMYQARIAYVLILLARTGHPDLVGLVRGPLERMLQALERLCHPDGEIALLNDSAIGIANPPAQLCDSQLCDSGLAEGTFALANTGYYGARHADGSYVVCDAAPVGPDYLPGHAHGDIFSFELSLNGRRVIVDSGVYGYEADEMRRYCRSTRAHNTVEIDGQDQCEFWGAFRVAHRGRPRDVAWRECDGGFRLEGWHDGYERLAGRPRHHRRFRWYEAGVLLVRDRITSAREVQVCSRIQLHPDCELVEEVGLEARLRHPGGSLSVHFGGSGALSVEPSFYCPEFGKKLESRALVHVARGSRLEMGFCIAKGAETLGYDLVSGATVNGERYPW